MRNPLDYPATSRLPAAGVRERGRSGYDTDWALFADWCAAAGHNPIPATSDMLLEFSLMAPVRRRRSPAG